MKYRRHGLIASTVLALSMAVTGCGGGSSAASEAASSASSSAAAAKVVTHVMEAPGKQSDPRTTLRPGPPVTGPIPDGITGSNNKVKAEPFDGVPKVGAVFFSVGGVVSAHYCTGSVVHSASGDLIVTAAHCVYNKLFGGWQDHIAFVPGYHDDIAPYGVWVATTAYLNTKWISKQDQDVDVAFLKVRKSGGGSETLESVTGADTFTTWPGYQNSVSVAAYPLTASRPVGCSGTTKKYTGTQIELDCGGLPDGASGSPFIASGNRLVGVLGGFEQGGNTPDTSYSVYFSDRVAEIYRATAGS
jgi:V8-like Glu-specific endopeptidase